MRIKLPFFILVFFVLISGAGYSQNTCGTGVPSAEWEASFARQIEIYKNANKVMEKTCPEAVHIIPVVVHIVHFNHPLNTFPNIDSNQVKSQIDILNADFAGTGLNSTNVPPAFQNLVANTQIQFCLATKDHTGTAMIVRGVDRVNCTQFNWENPATATLNLQQYFNSVIIPNTIWDPTRYLNIWVSDRPATQKLNSFGTYPAQTGLVGLPSGGPYGTFNNDGIWVYVRAFGTGSNVIAPTDKGRTAVHQLGHWLGLRHIWGDGNCLSDYAQDTPPSKGPHFGCVPVPTPIDQCGTGLSPSGEMPMNFMDESDDACKYMFTHDQKTRMLTAMSQCTQRNTLGTHDLCWKDPLNVAAAPKAAFGLTFGCAKGPVFPYNTTTGCPSPAFQWNSNPPVTFSPAATVANPNIYFPASGHYTISLVASNALGASTFTQLVTVTGSCGVITSCQDSIEMIRRADTLTTYAAPLNNSVIDCMQAPTGNLVGTNCYDDKEFAQYFPPSTYTAIPFPQINSMVVLFDSAGTGPRTSGASVVCKIYGGNALQGPGSTPIGSPKITTVGAIRSSANTATVDYLGKVGYLTPNKRMIPYRFDFASPIVINNPSSGFFASIEVPTFDSVRIYSDTKFNSVYDSTSWYRNSNSTWRAFKTHRGAKIHLAMIPIISCSPLVGIEERSMVFNSSVNVMPNPASGVFQLLLTMPELQENVIISIYDAVGQRITTEQLSSVDNAALTLDLSTKPEGIYFCEVTNGSERVVKKLVISR
jgi:hypothetical protein